MNTAVINHRRSLLPAFNLVLASGALVLAVIALEADDVGPAVAPVSAASVATIVGPAHPLGAPDSGIPCNSLVFTRC
jgi:hypothetical protein